MIIRRRMQKDCNHIHVVGRREIDMKRCYLFGAGAEVQFGMDSSYNFARQVLGLKCPGMDDAMDEAIKKYYKSKEMPAWYPPFTITKWDKKAIINAAIKKKLLDTDQLIDTKKDFDNCISIKYKHIKKRKKEREELLNNYTSYMGLIDERFHTLICPKALGPNKFWSVVTCYCRAYLSLAGKIIYGNDQNTKDDYLWILKNPKDAIEEMYEKCIRIGGKDENKENYYSIINEYDKGNQIGIITTNYTPFCRCLSGYDEKKIAYLHGRFGLFESPYELKVYDVETDEIPDGTVTFPFIFIQSGIKPIVDIKQVNEYIKMKKILDKSDELIIVGYKLNSDDNHINSIIRSYLIDSKKYVKFFDYDAGSSDKIVLDRLRINEKVDQFERIPITKQNCYATFKEYISRN